LSVASPQLRARFCGFHTNMLGTITLAMADARARKKGPAAGKRDVIGLRVPKKQLDEIDRRAKRLRLTRTEYMIRAALGEVLDPRSLEERVGEPQPAGAARRAQQADARAHGGVSEIAREDVLDAPLH
jgi:hypothetical protein